MPQARSKAVTTAPKELTPEELTALLQKAGFAPKPSGDSLPRMSLNGMMLTTPEGGMYVYNPNKPDVPALTVRIVRPPEEYFAIWIDSTVARGFNRPDLEGTFSKSWINPDPSRKVWPSDEVYEELRGRTDLVDDDGHPVKSTYKGDMLVQIIPEDGQLSGDEPVYLLTLSTTSLLEFKGTREAPAKGVVSDEAFITKLSKFAMRREGVSDMSAAVLNAMTSLQLGGIAAEVRIIRAENKQFNTTWSVIVFDPIHIEDMEEGDALLTSGETAE